VLEDFLDDFLVLYESDDTHLALTFGAGKRIYLIYLLDQPGPVSSEFFR